MASTTNTCGRANSVRRSLFGPVDHEQLRRELRQRLREMSEQDSRRWNFNFQTDTPLAGRFQWEEVPPESAAGAAAEPDRQPAGRGCSEAADRLSAAAAATDQENRSSVSNTRLRCPAEETPARRKRARSRSVDKSVKCARITDFFAKRRRTTESKSAQSPFHADTALCKTIR